MKKKKGELFVVSYFVPFIPINYVCITDNFDKWLKWHNKRRIDVGEEPEKVEVFVVNSVSVQMFNKKIKEIRL